MRTMTIWILAAVFGAACLATAQTKTAVGFVVGGNYNIHTGSVLEKTATGQGFVGGLQFDLSFSKSLALLTTIYAYNNLSGSYMHDITISSLPFTEEKSVTISYAGIEPLLKYTMPDDRFFLVAGPGIGFKLEGQEDETQTTTTPTTDFPYGYSYQSTYALADVNIRFDLNFGGGYIFRIDPTSRLTTQLTFSYGLNNIEKNVDWHINSIRLVAGLEFDIFQ